jgi:phage baseplate assembly protein gpV
MMGKLNNAQRADMARMLADSRASVRIGIIKSYDPATYTAKAEIQPEGTLTGWLPILPMMVGNGFGAYFGPSVDDQCIVTHLEGDLESGMISGFLPSDSEVPPTVESGEIFIGDKIGSTIVFTKDGNLTVTTNKDLDLTVAGDVNATVTGDLNADISGDTSVSCSGTLVVTCDDINLGGTGGKKIALDQDPVSAGKVQASSTKVRAL